MHQFAELLLYCRVKWTASRTSSGLSSKQQFSWLTKSLDILESGEMVYVSFV